jgi:hypothetical protein
MAAKAANGTQGETCSRAGSPQPTGIASAIITKRPCLWVSGSTVSLTVLADAPTIIDQAELVMASRGPGARVG